MDEKQAAEADEKATRKKRNSDAISAMRPRPVGGEMSGYGICDNDRDRERRDAPFELALIGKRSLNSYTSM